MQERRTTIRVSHHCRTQYCPSEDLLPRDGRLLTLSERGAGLLAREVHWEGERVTLNFAVPGEREPMTATGTVRWSHPRPRRGRWYPIGIEWLSLDETTRERLHRFLSSRYTTPSPVARPGAPRRVVVGSSWRWALVITMVVAVFGAVGFLLHVRNLQQENRQLTANVEQRDLVIAKLKQNERLLQGELTTAQAHLAATAEEVDRLDQQAQQLGGQIQQLTQDVDRFQQSYAQAKEEREALLAHVADLEQERAIVARRLSSITELRLAIREAIDAHKQAHERERQLRAQAQRDAQVQWLSEGNRGYLIRAGKPTVGRSTMWIKVHELEPVSNPDASSP